MFREYIPAPYIIEGRPSISADVGGTAHGAFHAVAEWSEAGGSVLTAVIGLPWVLPGGYRNLRATFKLGFRTKTSAYAVIGYASAHAEILCRVTRPLASDMTLMEDVATPVRFVDHSVAPVLSPPIRLTDDPSGTYTVTMPISLPTPTVDRSIMIFSVFATANTAVGALLGQAKAEITGTLYLIILEGLD